MTDTPPPRPTLRSLVATVRETASLALRGIGLVRRSSPRGTAVLGVLTVCIALVPLAVAYAGKRIVDAVVARSLEETLRWVLVELGIVAIQAGLQRGLGLARELAGQRLALDINAAILEKAQTLELRHFEDGRFYDGLTRARREASWRPLGVVTEGFQLAQNALTFAGYVALIVGYHPLAALVLLAAAIPSTISEVVFSRSAFRLFAWKAPESRTHSYLEYALSSVGYVKEMRLFGLGPLFLERYRAIGERFYDADRRLALRRAFWAYVLSLVASGAFYACYAFMALAAARGAITIGEMTLYVIAFRQGQQALQSFLGGLGTLYEHTLYLATFFEYLGIPIDVAKPDGRPVALTAKGEQPFIRFEDVGFRYPAQEKAAKGKPEAEGGRWALRHLDLEIPRGQAVALVGQNGAGKTTIVKLLTKLYVPTEGRILLEGKDLREWDSRELRARVGVIFQDFNEYQVEARENVALGSVEHREDDARVGRAAAAGGADEVFRELPDGSATRLGTWAHDGVELSGGQWQKVAISRAFMREEAQILVLDEPTAALDAEAEHAVFERFKLLARERTTLLISHRFSTVRMADRILVLEGGAIIEDGSHDALMAKGGKYARLFGLQAKGYA